MLKNQQAPTAARRWALFAGVCAASLALDLVTKEWAWTTLRPPTGGPWVLWPGVFELHFAYNQGSAFGVIREVGAPWWLVAIVAVLTVWVASLVRAPTTRTPGVVGAAMILAGALGNLHDRFFRLDELGRPGVVDFIKVHYPWGGSWPNFNIADALLVVGVVLMVLWGTRPADKPAKPA